MSECREELEAIHVHVECCDPDVLTHTSKDTGDSSSAVDYHVNVSTSPEIISVMLHL